MILASRCSCLFTHNYKNYESKKPSKATIQAWQQSSPLWDILTRVLRFAFIIPLFLIQLPLVVLDTIIGGRYYGRPKWSFAERALLLIGSYFIWSDNPGTRPANDVVSYSARSHPGRLRGKRRAKLIDVPARPDKLFGDAVHQTWYLKNVRASGCGWMATWPHRWMIPFQLRREKW